LSSPDQARTPISVVILTLDEELNLPPCLTSVRDVATDVFVVDAGSTDSTRRIAEEFGAQVVEHRFETHTAQWRWALDHLPIRTEWVLALDADQRLTPELASELQNLSAAGVSGISGLYVKRQQWFRHRWIKHGGYYPKYLLKLFRRSDVLMDSTDLVDHHFYVSGAVRKLRNDLIEANRKEDDISFWIAKHNRYATMLAQEELRRRGTRTAIEPAWLGSPDQQVLALKGIWRTMPLYVRPFIYFFYRYFLRFGFLDGKQGAIFHFLQAFWFRLLVDINIDDLRHSNVSGESAGQLSSVGTADIKTGTTPSA
jgi:glycosyltransferase involved in cell wall biosynthesis